MSTVNAIAGAYAEHVGLIHIVGVPAQSSQNKKLLLHHTLGNGDFLVYSRMSKEISEKVYYLDDAEASPDKIDDAIRTAFLKQRPVYIAIPTNVGELPLEKALLDKPLNLDPPKDDEVAKEEVVDTITELISKAKNPIIIVDACAARHGCRKETTELAEVTQFPVFTTPMGKSVFAENNPRFGGVYIGSLSSPEVAKVVESSDLVLSVGALLSDFNTGSFTYGYHTNNIVEFHSDHIKVRKATYNVGMKSVLQTLVSSLPKNSPDTAAPIPDLPRFTSSSENSELTQDFLWKRLSNWLRPGDVIITETGTSSFGIVNTVFPENTVGISQVLYGSIGYSVGAALGAAIAIDEIDPERRVILFVGDGSLQLTVQAISTMIRWNLKPYLFILNNDGYTIERLIHGPTSGYNNIQPWKYIQTLEYFGATDFESISVKSTDELEEKFEDKKFSEPTNIRLIELILPKLDAPESLVKQAEITSKINSSS